jgi:hypothetical protein
MDFNPRFSIFVVVSLVLFLGVLRFSLRARPKLPAWRSIMIVATVVVVGGMLFARWGAMTGLPWWVYYTLPALLTVILPPLAFRMSSREVAEYLVLAFLMAPAIHTVFSLFLGWKEYMPFLPIPSLSELIGG